MSRDLNDTLVFVKVVEQGSFISAARALRLPKTTVSRKVQELEERLGAQLLHRTTRRLGLTEAGNVYYEHSQRIARDLAEAESAVTQLQAGPRGWLRFTAPYSIGIDKIAPLLGEFHARHPEVRVEMLLSNEPLDLIAGEIDVALRIGNLPDSNLIARPLGSLRIEAYAGTSYIERHGEPLHPDDLQHHRVLAMTKHRRGNAYCWTLDDGDGPRDFPVNPVLVANDPAALKGALLCGEGIIMGADMMVKTAVEKGLVRRVLAGWSGGEYALNAVFPRGHVQSPKVRAFVDFLLEHVQLDLDVMLRCCPVVRAAEAAQARVAGDPVAEDGARILADAVAP
ncbi:LysR family transcriptional regulator [Coralloluteibacterium stylophorae]|uniref:LysR family transcriptional regulator n=1 Tax=Coralloluteibacterium stylophorae TaxID=1776034 RepID=A0A8J7VQQ8_9GAMM|nr:LysR family transcriptional regulator [Coralloluteibacterium stylophorae]